MWIVTHAMGLGFTRIVSSYAEAIEEKNEMIKLYPALTVYIGKVWPDGYVVWEETELPR